MSDHLPVYMEIQVGGDVGIVDNDFVNSYSFNSVSHELDVLLKNGNSQLLLTVYDVTGKKVLSETHHGVQQIKTSFPYLRSGVYIINLRIGDKNTALKVVVL